MGRDTIAGLIAGILQKYSHDKKEVHKHTKTKKKDTHIFSDFHLHPTRNGIAPRTFLSSFQMKTALVK